MTYLHYEICQLLDSTSCQVLARDLQQRQKKIPYSKGLAMFIRVDSGSGVTGQIFFFYGGAVSCGFRRQGGGCGLINHPFFLLPRQKAWMSKDFSNREKKAECVPECDVQHLFCSEGEKRLWRESGRWDGEVGIQRSEEKRNFLSVNHDRSFTFYNPRKNSKRL
jgi:hypothetical protein